MARGPGRASLVRLSRCAVRGRSRGRRHHRRRRIAKLEPADFSEVGTSTKQRSNLAKQLGTAIAQDALQSPTGGDLAERFATRATLDVALGALTREELAVMWLRLVEDENRETVARKRGLSVAQVDMILFAARSIVRTLIAHANDDKVTDDERRALWAFLDGSSAAGRASAKAPLRPLQRLPAPRAHARPQSKKATLRAHNRCRWLAEAAPHACGQGRAAHASHTALGRCVVQLWLGSSGRARSWLCFWRLRRHRLDPRWGRCPPRERPS